MSAPPGATAVLRSADGREVAFVGVPAAFTKRPDAIVFQRIVYLPDYNEPPPDAAHFAYRAGVAVWCEPS